MRALVLVWLVACGGNGLPQDGELGGACYPNGTCNVTLFCEGGVCVAKDGGIASDGSMTTDATSCANDSALEPNDTVATAFQTPVASQQSTLTVAGLALCPVGDKDIFRVDIVTTSTGLTATIDYEAATPPVQASILSSGGTPIANTSPTTTPKQVRASAPNLPTGPYYVQVFSNGTNNYRLQLSVQ